MKKLLVNLSAIIFALLQSGCWASKGEEIGGGILGVFLFFIGAKILDINGPNKVGHITVMSFLEKVGFAFILIGIFCVIA